MKASWKTTWQHNANLFRKYFKDEMRCLRKAGQKIALEQTDAACTLRMANSDEEQVRASPPVRDARGATGLMRQRSGWRGPPAARPASDDA